MITHVVLASWTVIVLLALALAAIGLVVALVINRRTRVVGLVLLIAPVALVVLGAIVVFPLRYAARAEMPATVATEQARLLEQQARVMGQQAEARARIRAEQAKVADQRAAVIARAMDEVAAHYGKMGQPAATPAENTTAPDTTAAAAPPAAALKQAKSGGVIGALGRAVGMAIEQQRQEQARKRIKPPKPPRPAEALPTPEPAETAETAPPSSQPEPPKADEAAPPAKPDETASSQATEEPATSDKPSATEEPPPADKPATSRTPATSEEPAPAEPKPEKAESPEATTGNPKLDAMIKSLAGAVSDELPADIDELTALRTLGRYLGRIIAAEEARKAGGVPSTTSLAGDSSRPAWVDAPGGRRGDGYQMVATAGPYTSRIECDQALTAQLQSATADYVALYLGPQARYRVRLPDDYLRDHVVKEEWEEPIDSSIAPMIQLHARMVFDRQANERLKEAWRDVEVQERLAIGGVGLAAALGLVAAAFCLLKIDIVTKGAYRGWMIALLVAGGTVVGLIFLRLSPHVPDANANSGVYMVPQYLDHRPSTTYVTAASAEAGSDRGQPSHLFLGGVGLAVLLGGVLAWPKRTRPLGLVLLGTTAVVAAMLLWVSWT